VVLPNDPNAAAVAAAAVQEARAEKIHTAVVRTRSPVQALAALAVRDETRRFDDDVIEMAEAAGACRYAEVTVASRAALTMVGPCEPGDVIALIEGEVSLIGQDLEKGLPRPARPPPRRRRGTGHAGHRAKALRRT
jgi:dihydroxyacetone kinase-like predicted kinase